MLAYMLLLLLPNKHLSGHVKATEEEGITKNI